MEQDRAPVVLPHLDELARPAADQPRSHRADHRRDDHQHRLTVHAELDEATYPKGVKIPDDDMKALETSRILTRHDFHGEWNYTLNPTSDDTPTTQPR